MWRSCEVRTTVAFCVMMSGWSTLAEAELKASWNVEAIPNQCQNQRGMSGGDVQQCARAES